MRFGNFKEQNEYIQFLHQKMTYNNFHVLQVKNKI